VSGEDLGAILVREGFAWAFTRYSVDYVDQQEEARRANRGVHAHDCVPAWEWRSKQRRPEDLRMATLIRHVSAAICWAQIAHLGLAVRLEAAVRNIGCAVVRRDGGGRGIVESS
jgi:hypothetical protein